MTNHKGIKATALTALIVLLVTAFWQWGGNLIDYAIAQHVTESQKKMKEEINKTIKELESENDKKAGELKELSEKVSELSQEVAVSNKEIAQLSKEIDSLATNVRGLTKQLHDLLIVLAKQTE